MRVTLMIIMDKAVTQVARVSQRSECLLLMEIKTLQINHKQYWFKQIKRKPSPSSKKLLTLFLKINRISRNKFKTLIKTKTQNNLKEVKQITKSTYLIKTTLSKVIRFKKLIRLKSTPNLIHNQIRPNKF